MNDIIKCPHCQRVFFKLHIDDVECPFCHRSIHDLPVFFENIFKNTQRKEEK